MGVVRLNGLTDGVRRAAAAAEGLPRPGKLFIAWTRERDKG